MEQNLKIQSSKNSVITKASYNNSLSHTTHNEMARSERFKREQFISSVKAILKEAKPDPAYEDYFNVLKIFRYLKDKKNYGISFKFNSEKKFEEYIDADFGGDLDTRKSTTGYLMIMSGGLTSWY